MRNRRAEKGAVTTIVAVLLAFGVVFGLLAISVDTGRLLVERRQLQNGADAAALSLAQSCAEGNCTANADNLVALTNANARDGKHNAAFQCGVNLPPPPPGFPALPACPAGSLELTKCPPLPPAYASYTNLPYVEVHTETLTDTSSQVTNIFSTAAGNSETGTTVNACARAAWGRPGGVTATTPITISVCEWQSYTNGGTSWVAAAPSGAWPGYGGPGQEPYPPAATNPNTPGHEIVITLHDPAKPPCSFNGKDTAGGFGYLDPTGSCQATVTTTGSGDQWSNIDTGSSATNDCKTYLANLYANGPVIDIPVFDCIVRDTTGVPTGGISGRDCTGASPGGGGAQSYYHIQGWAKFYLSGYKIGGSPDTERASRVSGTVPCSGSNRCISGWFVKGTLSQVATVVPPTPGTPDLGAYAVVPVG